MVHPKTPDKNQLYARSGALQPTADEVRVAGGDLFLADVSEIMGECSHKPMRRRPGVT